MRVLPSLGLYMILLEMTNKSRLKYSEGKSKILQFYTKEDSSKYVTQNVLKPLHHAHSLGCFGLISGSKVCLKGSSVFWKSCLCQEPLVQSAPGSLAWFLGTGINSGDYREKNIFFYSKIIFLSLNWYYLFSFFSQFEISWGRQKATSNGE